MATPSYQGAAPRLFEPSVLTTGETMRWEDRPHWIILFRSMTWFILISIVFIVVLCVGVWPFVFFWLIFGLLPFIMAFISWKCTLYGITSERALWQRGFLGKSRESVPFDKIINVGLDYGFIERIVGCGTITLATAAGVMKYTKRGGALGGGIYYRAVRNSEGVEKFLRDTIESEKRRKKAEEYQEMAKAMRGPEYAPTAPPVQPPPPPSSLCSTCGRPLTYVQQYQRWYCENCKKYV